MPFSSTTVSWFSSFRVITVRGDSSSRKSGGGEGEGVIRSIVGKKCEDGC